MNNQIFVDTNILVYAHDRDAGDKHSTAKKLVSDLWDRPMAPALSVQVLQELYVNLIRKQVAAIDARMTVVDYSTWQVVDNDAVLLMNGIRLREK